MNTIPAVNQVELHPFFAQEAALENMKSYGVHPQAWGPLAEGKHSIFSDKTLANIGANMASLLLKLFCVGTFSAEVSIILKSVHEERMKQNIDWDFKLTDDEMKAIGKVDIRHSEIVDHSSPSFVKMLHSWKLHN